MRNAFWKTLRDGLGRFESARVLISLLIVTAAMAFLSENFFTVSNITLVLSNQSIIGVIVIGELLVLLTGGIDISVGSVFGLSGMIAAVLLGQSVPALWAILAGTAAGLVVGAANGLLITRVRVTPFIVTLGMLGVVRGLTFMLTGARTVHISNTAFLYLDTGSLLFMPMPILVLLVIGVLFDIGLKRTVMGGRIYAVGGDEQAARMLGMKVQNIKLLVYSLSGVLAGFAGVLGAAKVSSATPLAGSGYEFDVIAAVIIGGALMEGGKGTVLGSVLGAIFIGILRNAIILLGVSPYWQQASSGLVIIAVIMASAVLARGRGEAIMSDYFLETRGLSKSFPGTQALDGVEFTVSRGEVHGLIGENGAGKSTLVNLVSGVYPPTAGEIFIEGQRVELKDPLEARRRGIVTIHQELSLFPNRDVAYNVFAGNEKRSGRFFLDRAEMERGADTLLKSLGLTLDPRLLVSRLTIAQQQLVEIARALSTNARLIFMDEPTSSLSVAEISMLEGIVARLKADGVSVVFVTHKLNEIMRFTDRTTILRDGKVVDTLPRSGYTYERFIQGMVGRRISEFFARQEKTIGDVCLEVKDLSTAFLKEISFTVRKGEVLGLAGPVGAGRTEIMQAIFGIDRITHGEIRVFGRPVHIRNPREAIRHGMALVPEDRKLEGVVLELPVKSNIVLAIVRKISRMGFLRTAERTRIVNDSMKSFAIKAHSTAQLVKSLSGGNQQKVVISKWLSTDPKILFLDEPTRGIDIGAKQEIYEIINTLARRGFSLILASSELEEVIRMSDRILVLYEGRVKATLESATATEEAVLTAAHG